STHKRSGYRSRCKGRVASPYPCCSSNILLPSCSLNHHAFSFLSQPGHATKREKLFPFPILIRSQAVSRVDGLLLAKLEAGIRESAFHKSFILRSSCCILQRAKESIKSDRNNNVENRN